MHPFMEQRVSVMSYTHCHFPLSYFLEKMEVFGLKHMELWGGYPHFCVDYDDAAQCKRIRADIKAHGLTLTAITPESINYPYNLAAREEVVREKSIAYFKRNITACKLLGCKLLVITPGYGYLNEPKEAAWERSRASLITLARFAQENGICLALEHLTTISSNLINFASELAQMVCEVQSPALRGMLDLGQMSILGETVEQYHTALGGDIAHVHIMDGRPAGHLAIGDGQLPLEFYVRELERLGYEGMISMEINDRAYYLDPDKAIQQSLTQMAQWFKA